MSGEDVEELGNVILRLASRSEGVGLTHVDVASLIGLPRSGWPMDGATLSALGLTGRQETRLRHLEEVCRLIEKVMDTGAAGWLRAPNPITGFAPLTFLHSRDDALRVLLDVLRR